MDEDSFLSDVDEGADIEALERRLQYQGLQIRLL